jgi:hypothetical protein
MLQKEQFWTNIEALVGRNLKTLAYGRAFTIRQVTSDRVVLSPLISGKPRTIPRNALEEAFHALMKRRELSHREIIMEFSNFNAVYIAALLAALPDVAACVHPIRLIFVGHQLFYLNED